jgi:chromosome segregation ATPase
MSYTIEDIRKEHAELAAKVLAANREYEGTLEQIASLEAQIVAAGAQYEEACLALADGKAADPGAVQAKQVALRHNLRGLEQARDRQAAEIRPLGARMQELDRLVAAQQLIDEEEQLLATHANLDRALKEATVRQGEATLAYRASLLAIDQFRTRKENRMSSEAWHRQRNG